MVSFISSPLFRDRIPQAGATIGGAAVSAVSRLGALLYSDPRLSPPESAGALVAIPHNARQLRYYRPAFWRHSGPMRNRHYFLFAVPRDILLQEGHIRC